MNIFIEPGFVYYENYFKLEKTYIRLELVDLYYKYIRQL